MFHALKTIHKSWFSFLSYKGSKAIFFLIFFPKRENCYKINQKSVFYRFFSWRLWWRLQFHYTDHTIRFLSHNSWFESMAILAIWNTFKDLDTTSYLGCPCGHYNSQFKKPGLMDHWDCLIQSQIICFLEDIPDGHQLPSNIW